MSGRQSAWNSFPAHLKDETLSLDSFNKRSLKTFLFATYQRQITVTCLVLTASMLRYFHRSVALLFFLFFCFYVSAFVLNKISRLNHWQYQRAERKEEEATIGPIASGVPRILKWEGSRCRRRREGSDVGRGHPPTHWGRVWEGGCAPSPENFSYFCCWKYHILTHSNTFIS